MFQALKDNVIVEPVYQKKISNIVIPEGSKFGKNSGHGMFQLYHGFIYGVVISIGPMFPSQVVYEKLYNKYGKEEADKSIKRNCSLRVGNKVIWSRHEGIRFEYDRTEYIKLQPKYLLGVIKCRKN